MKKDIVEGKVGEVVGAVKRTVGSALGDSDLERRGAEQEREGQLQQAAAKAVERARGAVDEALGTVESTVGAASGDPAMEARGRKKAAGGLSRRESSAT